MVATAGGETPATFEVETSGGKTRSLRCPVCQHDRFHAKRFMLNTKGLTFMGLDWMNDDATTLVCAGCGHMTWFAPLRR